MKQKLFSIFCCLLLSANMVVQAQKINASSVTKDWNGSPVEAVLENTTLSYSLLKGALITPQSITNHKIKGLSLRGNNGNHIRKSPTATQSYEWDCEFRYDGNDVISSSVFNDNTGCAADFNPTGSSFIKFIFQSTRAGKAAMLFFYPKQDGSTLRYYNSVRGPIPNTYSTNTPYTKNYGCGGGTYKFWTGCSVNTFMGYAYYSSWDWLFFASSHVGSWDGSNYEAEWAHNDATVEVAEGHNGDMFLELTCGTDVHYVVGERKYTYNVNVATNNASLGTVSKNKSSVTEGGSVTLTATETGGTFLGWSLDGGTNIIAGTSSQLTYSPTLGADAGSDGQTFTYTAVFEASGQKYTVNYGVNIDAGGSITATYGNSATNFASGKNDFEGGTSVTLTATANTVNGYRFVKWSNNVATPTITFNVSKDTTLTAQFVKTYTISTACEDEDGNTTNKGSIIGGGTKDNDSTCTLTASSTEPLNYYFKKWKDTDSTIASRTFTVSSTTAAPTYTAVIAAREVVNITASSDMEMTKTGEYWSVSGEGTDASDSYTMNIRFDAASLTGNFNSGVNTANTWVKKGDESKVYAQNISVATVNEPTTGRLHIVATIIGTDEKKYVITGDYDKPIVGSLAAFSFDDPNDEFDMGTWTDAANSCNAVWQPYGQTFAYIEVVNKTKSTNNYLWLVFKTNNSINYNGHIAPAEGDYPMRVPNPWGYKLQQCPGDWQDYSYYFWQFDDNATNVAVSYYNDNETPVEMGRCPQSSYLRNYVNGQESGDLITFNNRVVRVSTGKGGNPFIQIINTSTNEVLVSIGTPAKHYNLAWDANGGELSGTYTAAGSYEAGATITAPTTTKPGYILTQWRDTTNSVNFNGTMPSNNVTYTAQWEVAERTVTITAPTGGTITVTDGTTAITSGSQAYSPNSTITLTATPATDYEFVSWNSGTPALTDETTEDGVVSGTFTLTKDTTVGATFRRVRYDELTLEDNRDAAYYNTFADDYDSVKVETVTYSRTFKPERWSTICLPFEYNQAQMEGHPLKGNINEYLYSEGNADLSGSGLILYFKSAKSIEAGKPYLVRNNTGSDIVNPIFGEVTIDTDKDTEDADIDYIRSKFSYKKSGSISLVGTFRKIQLPVKNHAYMGLMYDETAGKTKIYYPGTNANVPAYRAFFYDSNPASASVQQRVRIVVDGVDMGELLIDNGELLDADKADDRAPRKYIRNGVLVIERNGVTYDAQGKRL